MFKITPFSIALCLSFISMSFSSDKQAYSIYEINGKVSNYTRMLERLNEADIILFGELHNNPIAHWLEYEITVDLLESKKQNLILGAEMFESDDQLILNEYLNGFITDKTFKDEAKDWPNYTTDYKPLLDMAKKNKLEFIATNIPRRYANMVFNRGIKSLDSISIEAKQWICPLPFAYDSNLACYKEISKATGGHGGENLKLSQASKDATMAHFILKHFKTGHTFIHYNGSYHSNNYESIVWYLRQSNPNLDIVTINTIETESIEDFKTDAKGSANYIIHIPSSMTKTY